MLRNIKAVKHYVGRRRKRRTLAPISTEEGISANLWLDNGMGGIETPWNDSDTWSD